MQPTQLPLVTKGFFALFLVSVVTFSAKAAEQQPPESTSETEALHLRVNALLSQSLDGKEIAPQANDAEFIRRVYLDLIGRIPSVAETRLFLADNSNDKRVAVIDRLQSSSEHARRMHELFHVLLMERRAEDAHWADYLRRSFLANRGWDQMVGDFLTPDHENQERRGAAFFLTSRLTKEGAMAPVDFPGLTRDVGRLLAGVDLQCAQCHDHININDYRQQDFQGLHMIFENIEARRDTNFPAVSEKLVAEPKEYVSVFTQVKAKTGVAVPGGPMIEVVKYEQGEEYLVPPDTKKRLPGIPKFSPLRELATQLISADNKYFSRNIANRLWFVMMGRGLVEPLDLHHTDNPPSHPELLDLLASDLAEHNFDLRYFIRELALSDVYQRTSRTTGEVSAERYAVAHEKRLSAEQLFWSVMVATDELSRVRGDLQKQKDEKPTEEQQDEPKGDDKKEVAPAPLTDDEQLVKEVDSLQKLQELFRKTFANPPKEAEVDFQPTVKAALFLMHDESVLKLIRQRSGNAIDEISKLKDDEKLIDELFLRFFNRPPTTEDLQDMKQHLERRADQRNDAVWEIAWALLASTEFCVNH
ncbi:MAG: hypothetical protein ACI9G1_002416 [Pirellulaceae bacterium]|jgi:hypothetical protein